MSGRTAPDPAQHARLERATAALDPPFVAVDLDAFDANAADLVRRAAPTPIRVASKSVRVPALLRRVLARPGYAGILALSLPEALNSRASRERWSPDGTDRYTTGRRLVTTIVEDALLIHPRSSATVRSTAYVPGLR